MLVANSFDLWRKDAFFSAAEEVQESADIMESAYRAWLREKRERSKPEELYEQSRELQTALGTAKWQLEEFEKAVRLSYRHGDDTTTARHQQFISAIECLISQVETALRETYSEEGKQPLRWVNLDEEERDDLAAFLSGTCQSMQSNRDECGDATSSLKSSFLEKQVSRGDRNVHVNAACNWDVSTSERAPKDVIAIKDANYVLEIKTDTVSRDSDDVVSQTDRTISTRKTWSPPRHGALKIVIADDNDEQRNKLVRPIDTTPKEKGFKSLFRKQKCLEYHQAVRTGPMLNQVFGRVGLCHRQFQSPLQLRYGCSIQVKLALMLTIFIIVPFVLYSS